MVHAEFGNQKYRKLAHPAVWVKRIIIKARNLELKGYSGICPTMLLPLGLSVFSAHCHFISRKLQGELSHVLIFTE